MAAAGKPFEPVVYKSVGHGFTQAGMGDRIILDPEREKTA